MRSLLPVWITGARSAPRVSRLLKSFRRILARCRSVQLARPQALWVLSTLLFLGICASLLLVRSEVRNRAFWNLDGGAGREGLVKEVKDDWNEDLTATTVGTGEGLSMEIVLLVTDDERLDIGIENILNQLKEAHYDNESVNLRMVIAQGIAPQRLGAVRGMYANLGWDHGQKVTFNCTRQSSGYFSAVLAAWVPQRGDETPVLILDVAHMLRWRAITDAGKSTIFISPQYYRYLKSARYRYSRKPDIAAFALEPTAVRAPSSTKSWLAHSSVSIPPSADAYLYQSAANVGVLSPFDSSTWRTFLRWFEAHRAEWYLWPVVASNRKDRYDPSWKKFRGNHRAHWTLWWSRFCVEHGLYNLYPAHSRPEPLPPIGRELHSLPQYDHRGKLKESSNAQDLAGLQKIIQLGEAQGGNISLTVVNDAFVATAESWVCNVDTAGIRPPGVVFITTDQYSYDSMSKVKGAAAILLENIKGGGKEKTGTSFGTPGYWLLMLERTRLISNILDAGIGIFAFETDQIWLRDPLPHVRRLVDSGDEVDMVGTLDSRNEIGGNFLYLNPTLATRRLWREVASRFEASYMRNRVAQRMKARNMKHYYIENDQSILTKLVFYNETFRRMTPVVFRALDTERFVDGRWYNGSKFYSSPESRSPIMINNNFVIGIKQKRERAIAHGHWFWKDKERVCDEEAVKNAIMENERRSNGFIPFSRAKPAGEDLEVNVDDALAAMR